MILVRHGESLGNVDGSAYGRISDNQMPLTENGLNQADSAGQVLRRFLAEEERLLFQASIFIDHLTRLVCVWFHSCPLPHVGWSALMDLA